MPVTTGCQQTESVCPSAPLFGVRNLLVVTLTPLGVSLPTCGQLSALAAVGSEHGGWAETPDTHQRTQRHTYTTTTHRHTHHKCAPHASVFQRPSLQDTWGDSSFHYGEESAYRPAGTGFCVKISFHLLAEAPGHANACAVVRNGHGSCERPHPSCSRILPALGVVTALTSAIFLGVAPFHFLPD